MSRRSAEALMVLVTLLAAAGWVFTKESLAGFAPFTFLAMRFMLAGVVLACFCLPELARMPLRQHALAAASGAIQAGALLVWIHAMTTAPLLGEGAFIVSLSSVFMPLLGRLLFGEPIAPRLVAALPIAITGLALLSLEGGFALRASQWGFLLSSVAFSLHLVVAGRVARTVSAMPLTTWQLALTGIFGAVAAWMTEPFDLTASPRAWGFFLLSALVASCLRFSLQTRAIGHLSPTQVGMILVLEPVWVTMLGISLLNEQIPLSKIAGCALILGALLVYRVSWPSRKAVRLEGLR